MARPTTRIEIVFIPASQKTKDDPFGTRAYLAWKANGKWMDGGLAPLPVPDGTDQLTPDLLRSFMATIEERALEALNVSELERVA
ncbi:hypothetical protein ACFFTN_01380 [Aminobacter aganoensis]|uniref:Uncharacterized protein n=1 Tax=Aminobacter aganoensis TaxID=83264 RepID=A0A7X0KJW9_9HYPH|nr:hypothetical protein [Aminobacter aganoensis]MBB6353489.1 hypothetical protein [Aminobacter aganoensis]